MSQVFNLASIASLREKLNTHPVYRALRTMDDLRGFMAHHVYSVWDFMSLLKCLQHHIAPASSPWVPRGTPSVRRFINAIVIEEESDIGLPGPNGEETYASHFELYCEAMKEVGADASRPLEFVSIVRDRGIDAALAANIAPAASHRFTKTTFDFIATGKPHVIAAALALGREQIIPGMFRAILKDLQIGKDKAPAFHYYLERHIHLDEDFHGPLSLRMVDELCAGDTQKLKEAEAAAQQAIQARIDFWTGVMSAIMNAQLAQAVDATNA
jgi:Protein of unknown function (DUF3050)